MTKQGIIIEEKKDKGAADGKKLWIWIVKYRFVFIVLFIIVQDIIYHTYTSLGLSGANFLGSGMLILLLIFCVLAVSKDKRSLRNGLLWGGISMISVWTSLLFNIWPLSFIYLLFIIYTTGVIIYNVAVSKEINVNIIFGAIAGFLLIGVVGAAICSSLELFYPGSFTLTEGMGNYATTFYYFSIITMTSLGYGDITPATDIARSISAYLVIFGQLYLVILVAILVGKFIKRSDTKKIEKDIEDLKREIQSLKK
ncbi:MAG: hypothetical protein JSV17_04010 [Candidatus Aminicenantes bacterium]|nr:MAG: hypothetical protein JSV17_04010 [Candidatus Aminicenantes bacterium]